MAPREAPGVDAVPSELKAGFALHCTPLKWCGLVDAQRSVEESM